MCLWRGNCASGLKTLNKYTDNTPSPLKNTKMIYLQPDIHAKHQLLAKHVSSLMQRVLHSKAVRYTNGRTTSFWLNTNIRTIVLLPGRGDDAMLLLITSKVAGDTRTMVKYVHVTTSTIESGTTAG